MYIVQLYKYSVDYLDYTTFLSYVRKITKISLKFYFTFHSIFNFVHITKNENNHSSGKCNNTTYTVNRQTNIQHSNFQKVISNGITSFLKHYFC
jgi:hypothetical protein